MTATRYPFADLEAHLNPVTTRTLAERLGVSTRTVWRWRASGLNQTQADHAAVAVGLHPGTVWPTWWNTAA